MKEIKFKCWFKSSKIMSREFSIENIKNSEVDLLDGATYLQYTGLKDKNGKEIYEGDVIKVDKASSNFDKDIAKVVFENGCFLLKTIEFEYDLTEHFIQDFNNRGWYEVIGNIYENPKLLKETL